MYRRRRRPRGLRQPVAGGAEGLRRYATVTFTITITTTTTTTTTFTTTSTTSTTSAAT